jgi:hypothetical protein
MTNDDRISALSLSTENQVRDRESRENIGGLVIKKSNGKGAYGAEVGDFLWRNNGTFVWDMDDMSRGIEVYDNIHQAIAAEIHAPGAKAGLRRDIGRDYEADVRSGIKNLAKWLDEQFGIPIYRCKTPGSKNQITVITIHPDFVVDPDTGTTAKDSQRKRDKDALLGQTKSTLKRMIRDDGEAVREAIGNELWDVAISYNPPTPKRR